MNASSLPLGHAGFELVSSNEDGSFLRCPYVSRARAEEAAAFLKQTSPTGTFFVTEPTPVLPGLRGLV